MKLFIRIMQYYFKAISAKPTYKMSTHYRKTTDLRSLFSVIFIFCLNVLLIHNFSLDTFVAFILLSFYSCHIYIYMLYIDMHLVPAVFYTFSPFIHFKVRLRFFYCLLR